MTPFITRRLFAAAAVVVVSGCASPDAAGPGAAVVEPGTGLAFGAIDTGRSDLGVTHVVLLRISPTKMYMGGSGERVTVTYTHGEFYAPNLSPGLYAVNGFYSGNQPFAMEGNLRNNTFRVEPGAVVYAGSYRVNHQPSGGLLSRSAGSFERVDSKEAETRLLRWLGQELGTAGWGPKVRERR